MTQLAQFAENWPQDRIERLRKLWHGGLSAREIGLELGVTKNSVISKVRRMGLPFRREPEQPRRQIFALADAKTQNCMYPLGEPRDDNFRFCGASVTISANGARSSYCAKHHAICYIPRGQK